MCRRYGSTVGNDMRNTKKNVHTRLIEVAKKKKHFILTKKKTRVMVVKPKRLYRCRISYMNIQFTVHPASAEYNESYEILKIIFK